MGVDTYVHGYIYVCGGARSCVYIWYPLGCREGMVWQVAWSKGHGRDDRGSLAALVRGESWW